MEAEELNSNDRTSKTNLYGGAVGTPVEMKSVVVAVNGGSGIEGGNGSRRAVRWAVENLMMEADRFILVHVMPSITSIPTPSGECIPVAELDENVVKLYLEDMKLKIEEIFIPYKKLCKARKVETLVLEDDKPAAALLRYVSEAGINSLVLGSCSTNCIMKMEAKIELLEKEVAKKFKGVEDELNAIKFGMTEMKEMIAMLYQKRLKGLNRLEDKVVLLEGRNVRPPIIQE